MRIIPAIDILGGKCVRLTRGEYDSPTLYSDDPLDIAQRFEEAGIRHLHLVDLDGAREKHVVNINVLERIASRTKLKVDFGGGIKSEEDILSAFNAGAGQITAGSIAADQPDVVIRWIEQFGAERIILGADARNRKIATHGWTQESELDVLDFIRSYAGRGIKQVICTDIGLDGTLLGSSKDLYREILSEINIQLIASGGVNSVEDLLALREIGCEGAIVGKAFYEGRISLKQLADLC